MTDKESEEPLGQQNQQVRLEEEALEQSAAASEKIPFSKKTPGAPSSSENQDPNSEEQDLSSTLNSESSDPEQQFEEKESSDQNQDFSSPAEQYPQDKEMPQSSDASEEVPFSEEESLPEPPPNPTKPENPEKQGEEVPQEQVINAPEETVLESIEEKASDEQQELPTKSKGADVSVDFDLMNTEGRWLLKVISGPNSGAEFAMHAGTSYIIGMDTKSCDIIFQDMSVSRKHAKITIDEHQHVTLEDLNSRNGTFVNGEKVDHVDISGNAVVNMGTTTFLLLDREAEQTTIVAKKMQEAGETPPIDEPSKPLKEPSPDLATIQSAVMAPMQSEVMKVKQGEQQEAKSAHAVSSLIILAIVTGLLMIVGVSATFLFKTEEITAPVSINPDAEITKALSQFPSIRFSYNPVNHRLLLVGHLLTITDRSKLLDRLQSLTFISDIDYNNVVIDELVWRDFNQTLAKNPSWKGINITATSAGHFIVSGFLQTKSQASELSDYISQNFPYIDLLERKIIVEEDLLNQINRELSEAGFKAVTATISGGDLTLSGSIAQGAQAQFSKICTLFKSVPGVRSIQVLVAEAGQKEAMIDISEKYSVSGFSKRGNQRSVVIGGKFLSVGDSLEGMYISSITDTTIFLEKDGVKYKIDFNH